MLRHLKRHRSKIWFSTVVLSSALLIFIGLSYFYSSYDGKIYPNVFIGEKDFGGMTREEARNFLAGKSQAMLASGLTINIKDRDVDFSLEQYGSDPDLSRELLRLSVEKTIDELYYAGRVKYGFLPGILGAVGSLSGKEKKEAIWEYDRKTLLLYFDKNLSKYESAAKNAGVEFDGDDVIIKNDAVGLRLNYAGLLDELDARLKDLLPLKITAEFLPEMPEITREDAAGRESEIRDILAAAPVTIKYNDKEWVLTRADLRKYLGFEKSGGLVVVALEKEKSAAFLKKISEAVNVQAQNAKFMVYDGKVSEFQTSRIGMRVDEEGTRRAIGRVFRQIDGRREVGVLVDIEEPEITMDNVNSLGITDLLGVGESDFSGSPPNRIHNIKTGANKVNGLLLAPGEEFSALKAIGAVDEESGFKKELVIKENRTEPEFGGGLCQIGTTLFRGALASGLPITERRNHSYRVSYYEPAGTDATIYNPSPDFRFKNDMPGYILIQGKIQGTKVVFEFWGKKDGRESSRTNPVIKNIVEPPPIKYIYTTDLKPGEKKRVEVAHKGADAYFKYTVKYPDERGTVEKTFFSRYKPWAEVWLLGATSTTE
jgi:vancomycin resistance protein YoaR